MKKNAASRANLRPDQRRYWRPWSDSEVIADRSVPGTGLERADTVMRRMGRFETA